MCGNPIEFTSSQGDAYPEGIMDQTGTDLVRGVIKICTSEASQEYAAGAGRNPSDAECAETSDSDLSRLVPGIIGSIIVSGLGTLEDRGIAAPASSRMPCSSDGCVCS